MATGLAAQATRPLLAARARAASATGAACALMHYAMLSPTLGLLLAFLALPAIYVGWLSLHASTYGQSANFVGLANYAQIFGDPIFWRAFWNTFFVVNGIVYGELLLGLGLAVLLSRAGAREAAGVRGDPRAVRDHREQRHRDVALHARARCRHGDALPRARSASGSSTGRPIPCRR